VTKARPYTSEIASPGKIGSAKLNAEPIIAARRLGRNRRRALQTDLSHGRGGDDRLGATALNAAKTATRTRN